jgi:hypothetical protein
VPSLTFTNPSCHYASGVRALDVFRDVRAHLGDEAHQSQPTTYALMRALYVRSRGRSQKAWSLLFRVFRRPGRRLSDDLQIANEVRARGYAVRSGFLNNGQVKAMRSHLESQPGHMRTRVRIDYAPEAILSMPGIGEVLAHPELLAAARNYLGTEPIFAGVNAWQSLHDANATSEEYSESAQLFHFDCDWPRFIKFFIYLTDVTESDGPFSIIEGTHRRKPVWSDGRFAEVDLLDGHGLRSSERRLTGDVGTLIAADTSAFHRGTPVLRGPRLMLQLEFAVSRLGASAQYPLLPAAARPKAGGPHTFDVFAAWA